MLPPRQRDSKEQQFSFSNTSERTHEATKDPKAMEYDTWAEKIKGKYNYFGRPEDVKFGAWTRSGGSSPLLESHISNGSRASSIAKFRREMLDTVRDMPENTYELSLIDIVESPSPKIVEDVPEEETKTKKKEKKGMKGMMRKVSRSESMDSGGHMLKMFMLRRPAALGGRRHSGSMSGKISPAKPASLDGDGDERKMMEGEWWSNEFGEMISSTSSSNSNTSGSSTSSSHKNSSISTRLIGSCYPFVGHKDKSMGVKD